MIGIGVGGAEILPAMEAMDTVEVVAGAILHWRGHTGISVGPDPDSSRREAALAMLQGRFARQAACLAWAINLLTLMLLGATLVLIWIGIATYRGH